jgi:hypothetical protein
LARAQWDNSRIYGVIEDLKKVMLANRVVLAADLDEEFPVSVDSTMESRGGIVFRWVVEE